MGPDKSAMLSNATEDALEADTVGQFLRDFSDFGDEEASGLDQALSAATADLCSENNPDMRRIASGLGVAPEILLRVIPGAEAGEDEGRIFYQVMVSGISIAVRDDGIKAHITDVLDENLASSRIREILTEVNLIGAANWERDGSLGTPAESWVLVAEGAAPVAGMPEEIEYFHPATPEEALQADTLSLVSLEIHGFMTSTTIDKEALEGLRAIAVVPGDVLAKGSPAVHGNSGTDVFGREIAPGMATEKGRMEVGSNVSLTDEGNYRAEQYGYMCFLDGRLSVLNPIWVSPDRMKAYWALLDDRPHPVTPEMITQCLLDMLVVSGVNEEKLQKESDQICAGNHERGMYLIAAGAAPTNGQDAEIEILVDLEKKAGKPLDDGSIDFRDVNFAPGVRVNQQIARRRPPTRGVAGVDIHGDAIEVSDGEELPLEAGQHVRVEKEGDVELFFSEIDGALRYEKDEMNVVELLVVRSDIDFEIGNLSFGGDVIINGSVVQGFSVKAGGEITISGTIDAGATVVSRGDIEVGKGIVGRKTKVVAQGNVRAQFVQEATVMAKGDIILRNYSYHAKLQCGGKLVVSRGKGPKGGSVMGGQTWAIQGIDLHIAGARSGSETMLVCGVNPGHVRVLDRLACDLDSCSNHIMHILGRFGLTEIDMTQITNLLTASTGHRRKMLAKQARQLGELAQVYQELLGQKKAIEEDLGEIGQDAQVKVAHSVFPGVTVRIGDYRRKIVDEIGGACFHVSDDKLVER